MLNWLYDWRVLTEQSGNSGSGMCVFSCFKWEACRDFGAGYISPENCVTWTPKKSQWYVNCHCNWFPDIATWVIPSILTWVLNFSLRGRLHQLKRRERGMKKKERWMLGTREKKSVRDMWKFNVTCPVERMKIALCTHLAPSPLPPFGRYRTELVRVGMKAAR
jgi:hypothetical protein